MYILQLLPGIWQDRHVDRTGAFPIHRLLLRDGVNSDLCWRLRCFWTSPHEALRVSLIARIQYLLTGDSQLPVTAGEHLLRRIAAQAAVVVSEVVSVKILLISLASVADVVKASGVIRLVLGSFELTLAEGVVVAHAGATVAAADPVLAHQIQIGTGDHGRTHGYTAKDATGSYHAEADELHYKRLATLLEETL